METSLERAAALPGPTATANRGGRTLFNSVVVVIAIATLLIIMVFIVSSCLSIVCRTTVLHILGGKFHATTSKYSLCWRHA